MNPEKGQAPTEDPKERLKKRWKKRSQVVVDSRMQYHFLKVWAGSALAILAVLAAFTYSSPVSAFFFGEEQQVMVIRGDLLRMLFLNYAVVVLFAASMGFYAILRLHRVAGAVFAMRRVLGRSAEGDLAVRVKLRDRDDLQELAEDINHMLVLREREMQDLSRAAEIASSIRGVIELDPDAKDDIQKLAVKLTRTIEGVEEAEPTSAPQGPG